MEPIGLAIEANEQRHPAPAAHPERSERLQLVLSELQSHEFLHLTSTIPVNPYKRDILCQIHHTEYIDRLTNVAPGGHTYLDPDTYMTARSFEASCRVTWSLLSAIDLAFGNGPRVSFVLGRPPGHHAEVDRGMGFCLVNHVAVAAQYALSQHTSGRVAIVDFDVHHGNGTQDIFYDRDDVLYISTHQYPFYPGTGAGDEQGSGAGEGYTLNLPFPAGTGDKEVLNAFEEKISPAITQFSPDLIIVSAGFDGHRYDPLGGFKLTGTGFRRIASILHSVASDVCEGRLVSVLEGGYDPQGNVDSIGSYVKGLAGV